MTIKLVLLKSGEDIIADVFSDGLLEKKKMQDWSVIILINPVLLRW